MDGQRGVLEHRIQIAAIGWRRQDAIEGIGRGEREQQETEAHEAEHAHHPAGETHRQVAAGHGHGQRPRREYPGPQQQ
jgi:hypothetical protein